MELLYNYIKKIGMISTNSIGMFVAANPECVGALEKLLKTGKVEEVANGLYRAK